MPDAARTRILLVDDDPVVRFAIADYFAAAEMAVTAADSCEAALAAARGEVHDLAILDHKLPDGDGLRLLRELRAVSPQIGVVFLTGLASIDLAVRAVKEGAEQFLTKPVELPALRVVVDRVVSERRNARLAASSRTRHAARPTSPPCQPLAEVAHRAAASHTSVMLLGETGVGKGVLARWLHDHSDRAGEAMVDLNCAGLSRELVESELFGHERGAFTGAATAKLGLLDIAHRGTLFLDEVADLDPVVQAKLLKVVEEQRFRRLGATADRQVSVRLITATSQNIEALVADGRFRRDLYFRLAAVVLEVPPLRERREEIPALATSLLRAVSPRPLAIDGEAIDWLRRQDWPGNVRELRNVLERASLFADGTTLGVRELQVSLRAPRAASEPPVRRAPRLTLEEVERAHIAGVMEEVDGRVERAAEWLGIPRSTLYERLRRYGLASTRGPTRSRG